MRSVIKKLLRDRKGSTLLELLVALFILVTSLVASISLIVNSINAGREARYRLIAASLAREAIEVARNMRDSNWYDPAKPDWNDGISLTLASPDTIATPVIVPSDGTLITEFNFDAVAPSAVQYLNGVGYIQGGSGADTIFFRQVQFSSICQADDGTEEVKSPRDTNACGGGFPNTVGVRIVAEVRWPNATSSKKVVVEDHLYNWYTQ